MYNANKDWKHTEVLNLAILTPEAQKFTINHFGYEEIFFISKGIKSVFCMPFTCSDNRRTLNPTVPICGPTGWIQTGSEGHKIYRLYIGIIQLATCIPLTPGIGVWIRAIQTVIVNASSCLQLADSLKVQNLDQVYVLVSSAFPTTCYNITNT